MCDGLTGQRGPFYMLVVPGKVFKALGNAVTVAVIDTHTHRVIQTQILR